jgi:HAE1 family hydrophobic/amphiphilic exporter-1
MFLSNLSIKHPVFATMMMAALAVLGIASYSQLKVDMFPKVEIPVVTVTTIYPGARSRRGSRRRSTPSRA